MTAAYDFMYFLVLSLSATVGVAVSVVWGNMGLSGGCLRESKMAGVTLLV
ncbi:unnamed protein product [Ectocarpus sp. CCAP 1310/34]|nr:unnamed protein product [Ectocarpus sp. CCAP 1310/34]